MKKEGQNIIIYNTKDGKASVSLFAKEGGVWMSQNQLAELFDTSKQNIGQHISNVFVGNELVEKSVVKNFFTTASDGKEYKVAFYALDMVLAIGFRVKSKRGTQFRIWANKNLKSYMIKGFVIDNERLKNPDGRPDYFDELLEQIRDIRASEKRFYQKVRELFTLSSDYDESDKVTQMFFAETQNKLLYAVTGKTAAEIIISRADDRKGNMALTSWKGKVVRKGDVFTAKNYLTKDEIDILNRLTVIFLETAELRVKDRVDITIKFWKDNIDKILVLNDKKVLTDKGKVTKKKMEEEVSNMYLKFNAKRKTQEAEQADLLDLKEIENSVKKNKANNKSL